MSKHQNTIEPETRQAASYSADFAIVSNIITRAQDGLLLSPGGSIRHCRGCSSSMARRHSAKRSETPSVWPPPSSAARSTRAVTSSSACPNICTRASRRRSVRPGTRTTQTRPSGSCATWSGVWSMRNRASRAASWRGWRRSSPSSASAYRTNSGARSPAPTSSRTRSARCARSPATSNAGDTPRWRSDGPPPACWRPRKPSVASRPIAGIVRANRLEPGSKVS